MCLKEFCFPIVERLHWWSLYLGILGKDLQAMNYHPNSLLSVVCIIFEKIVNTRIVHHLEKCGLFMTNSKILGLLDQLQIL